MEQTTRHFDLAAAEHLDCRRCTATAEIEHVVKVGNSFNCLESPDDEAGEAWKPMMSGWLCPSCFEQKAQRSEVWEGGELSVPGSDD